MSATVSIESANVQGAGGVSFRCGYSSSIKQSSIQHTVCVVAGVRNLGATVALWTKRVNEAEDSRVGRLYT